MKTLGLPRAHLIGALLQIGLEVNGEKMTRDMLLSWPTEKLEFFCLGAQLARLEIRVTLSMLFERLPSLDLAPAGPTWREGRVLRALERLPVTFDAF